MIFVSLVPATPHSLSGLIALKPSSSCRTCQAWKMRPTTNAKLAASDPINNVSRPDRHQGANDHRLFAAPIVKKTKAVIRMDKRNE